MTDETRPFTTEMPENSAEGVQWYPNAIRDKLADTRIYLEHFTRLLDRACENKIDEVAERLAVKKREVPVKLR